MSPVEFSSEQELIQKLRLDASQYMTELERLRAKINEYKKDIEEVRKTSQESVGNIAVARSRELGGGVDSAAMKKAVSEVSKARIQAMKAQEAEVKQQIMLQRELEKAEAQAAKVAAQGYSGNISAGERYRATIERIKNELTRLAAEQNKTLKDFVRSSKAEDYIAGGARVGSFTKQEGKQALRELTSETSTASGALAALGKTGAMAFLGVATAIGVATKALGMLIEFTKQAIQAAIQYEAASVRLEIAVRALQRGGIQTTIGEWRSEIQKLKSEFPIFSDQDLMGATSSALLLTREFGMTTDQMKNTIRVSAALSQMWGTDLTTSVRGLTYAISSGYFETLQRMGFQINRTIVAQEALKRGYEGGYQSLDDNIRAQITYDLIMKQAASLIEDSGAMAETTQGKIQKLSAAWENLKKTVGGVWNPAIGVLVDYLTQAVTAVENLIKLYEILKSVGVSTYATLAAASKMFWENLVEGGKYTIEDFQRLFEVGFYEGIKVSLEQKGILPKTALGDAPIGAGETSEEGGTYEQRVFLAEEFKKKINKVIEDGNKQIADSEAKFQQDMLDLEREYAERRAEIARQYAEKLAKIQEQSRKNTEKAARDYANDLAKIDRDYEDRKRELTQNYRDREIEEEERFKEKMRRLQEEFLFDLEDAVRARDAKQIRRLMRRYKLDQEQARRDYEMDKKARERAFERELEQLARQREIRRRERAIEYQERLMSIAQEKAYELAEAARWYQEEMSEAKRQYEEKKRQRIKEHQEELAEIRNGINEKLKAIAQGFATEYQITARNLKAIYDLLRAYYGPNGYIDQLYQYHAQATASNGSGSGSVPSGGVAPNSSGSVPNSSSVAPVGSSNMAVAPSGEQPLAATFAALAGVESVLVGPSIPNPSTGSRIPNPSTGSRIPNPSTGSRIPNPSTGSRWWGDGNSDPFQRMVRNVGRFFDGGGRSFGGSAGRPDQLVRIALSLSPDVEARVVERSINGSMAELENVIVTAERMR